jgi:hypothetical protein
VAYDTQESRSMDRERQILFACDSESLPWFWWRATDVFPFAGQLSEIVWSEDDSVHSILFLFCQSSAVGWRDCWTKSRDRRPDERLTIMFHTRTNDVKLSSEYCLLSEMKGLRGSLLSRQRLAIMFHMQTNDVNWEDNIGCYKKWRDCGGVCSLVNDWRSCSYEWWCEIERKIWFVVISQGTAEAPAISPTVNDHVHMSDDVKLRGKYDLLSEVEVPRRDLLSRQRLTIMFICEQMMWNRDENIGCCKKWRDCRGVCCPVDGSRSCESFSSVKKGEPWCEIERKALIGIV